MSISSYDGIALGRLLGRGATASVYCAKRGGQWLAVKQLADVSIRYSVAFRRELSILNSMQHTNIIQHLGNCSSPDMFSLFSEICEGGSVFTLIHRSEIELMASQRCKMLRDVASAVEYMHGLPQAVMHRDLKSLNLLLKSPVGLKGDIPWVKLCDFGSARAVEGSMDSEWQTVTQNVGTSQWMAPEVESGRYDEKVDVYSFAIVMYEILSYDIPFANLAPEDVRPSVHQGARPDLKGVDTGMTASLSSLMVQCWAQVPKNRPSFGNISAELQQNDLHKQRLLSL
mmetsp:Transcript_39942/g.87191  ORF Transcript_39942/g.87191 Transcript_39942/m.87191 type:complete len:285 (+) Transcript_39942:19-873(+)